MTAPGGSLPAAVILSRDGVDTRVGEGGIPYRDLAALRRQHERQAECRGVEPRWPLSAAHVGALASVLSAFPQARVELWR